MPLKLPPGKVIDPEQRVGITPDGDRFHAMRTADVSYCGIPHEADRGSRRGRERVIHDVVPLIRLFGSHRWDCERCRERDGFRIVDADAVDYDRIFDEYDL